jgi:hypothetical protein
VLKAGGWTWLITSRGLYEPDVLIDVKRLRLTAPDPVSCDAKKGAGSGSGQRR